MKGRFLSAFAAIALLSVGCGSVDRQMTINSNPSGALVYLNNQEVGRTPCTVDFTWYGRYDVTLRKEGYDSLRTTQTVVAPWWQWIPLDLLVDLTPGLKVDSHSYTYALKAASPEGVDSSVLIDRAQSMRPLLESGELTRRATTRPTAAPAKPGTLPTQ